MQSRKDAIRMLDNQGKNTNTLLLFLSSSIGATARCGLWLVEQYLSIFPYLSPTLSILSWVFLFVSYLPVLV
jgi:hypothetical protein